MSLDDLPGAGNRDDAGFAREPVALPPPATGVSLWAFALARDATALRELEALLSPDERARAARFGTHSLRDRYVVGRGTLRRLLGATLGCAPGAVAIRRGLRGRPQVDGAGFDFNVTHTAGVALVGIAAHGRIGVDIEHGDRRLNIDGISRKFMSAREQAYLATLEPDPRRRALLRLWTCKEAMSKATGDALSAPFRRMEVALATDLALRDGPAPYLSPDWRLVAARAPPAFVATVALWSGPGQTSGVPTGEFT